MEKITLKPTIKELLHRNGENGVNFDVLSYQATGNQEKILGSLFIIGQIKYSEEDMSYAVSLLSSLAKREYYSEQSLQGQDAKVAFMHTLEKLNGVLDDFFKNKGLKLNIGLAAISGENIYISRLGKFRIALTRNDKYIDVLSNIDLFTKDTEDAKQFSNIISGKLHPQDKIFAYFPTRSISAREKQINELFVKENQEVFSQKIANLAINASNFSCCGIHINMQEIKEIPVEARPIYGKPSLISKLDVSLAQNDENQSKQSVDAVDAEQTNVETGAQTTKNRDRSIISPLISSSPAQSPSVLRTSGSKDSSNMSNASNLRTDTTQQESPRIIPAEFSITKRSHLFTPLINPLFKLKNLNKLSLRARSRGFLLIVAIVLLPLLAIVLFRSIGPSSEVKNVIKTAGENLRLAQSRLSQNDTKDARALLQAALSTTINLSDKEAAEIKTEINQTLANINHASDKQPQLYFPASNPDSNIDIPEFKANLITAFTDSVAVINPAGTIFSLNQSNVSELAQFNTAPKLLFSSNTAITFFNGSDVFGVYNLESKKISTYSLKEPASAIDATLYEGNLYTLADNQIYKYADAITGGTQRVTWGTDNTSGSLISIAIDGNVYALNSDGKLIRYFKGAREAEIDLQLIPAANSHIFTLKDSAFIYLTDKTNGLVYIFDKATGELKTSYNLSPIYGEPAESTGSILDISVSPDGTVWILSADNKVWFIK